MGNAKTHWRKIYRPIYSERFNFLSLPPYSPQVNMIELVFNYVKSEVRKNQLKQEQDLKWAIILAFSNIKVEMMNNFYYHMLKYVIDCYENKNL